jgi:hypothetical protein
MKKQNLKTLKLNKSLVSHFVKRAINGGSSWPPADAPTDSCFGCGFPSPGQTGSLCLTGNQTNCQ